MTIRTVETSPGIYAQGELTSILRGPGNLATVKDGDTVHTGKLVPMRLYPKPESILPFE